MTREEFKKHIRNLFYSSKTVEKYLEQAYADIDKIFDEHEEELKQAYIDGSNSNNELIKFYLKRIEKLEKNA